MTNVQCWNKRNHGQTSKIKVYFNEFVANVLRDMHRIKKKSASSLRTKFEAAFSILSHLDVFAVLVTGPVIVLKVSKSQKQNWRKKLLPNLFFYPDGPEILKFQVIPDRQERKTNLSVRFWKKFFSSILLLRFIDLYTLLRSGSEWPFDQA